MLEQLLPSPRKPCSICVQETAKYTCPRCSTHTCSLQCSNTHKAKTNCSGIRNKVTYIPMNDYGYGALMNDYIYLEDVGRHVEEWGREISQGGFVSESRGGAGRRRGHAGGMRYARGGRNTTSRRDILKMQLDNRDIEMVQLPVGMERRKLNQSRWDFKNKTALLTVQFTLHPPPDPLRPSHVPPDRPITFISHCNNLDTPLISVLQKHVSDKARSKKDGDIPGWVKDLVLSEDAEAFTAPACYMLAPSDPTRRSPTYYKFDPTQKLSIVLRHKEFVEFPIIEVWEEGTFIGSVINNHMEVAKEGDDRVAKRRKLDVRKGKLAIKGLLGDYGSDEEEEDEPDMFSKLDNYGNSDPEHDEDIDIEIEEWSDAEAEKDDSQNEGFL